jgi:hypothetical protein
MSSLKSWRYKMAHEEQRASAGFSNVELLNPKLRVKFLRSQNVLGEKDGIIDRTLKTPSSNEKGKFDIGNLIITMDEGEAYIDLPYSDDGTSSAGFDAVQRVVLGGIQFVDTKEQLYKIAADIKTQIKAGKRPMRKIFYCLEDRGGYMFFSDDSGINVDEMNMTNMIPYHTTWCEFAD